MALGNNYSANIDNNKKNKNISEIYVPAFNTSSPEGLDPSSLSYSYAGNGFLRITITPLKFDNPNDSAAYKYDNDNATFILLSPTKAQVFAREIRTLLANKDTINNVGVNTISSKDNHITYIIFSNGKELGVENNCLIIRKMDETGNILSTYGYQFKGNPNLFGIRNFDESSKHFERSEYPDMEIENLLTILEGFYKSMSGTQAFANAYYGRFEQSKVMGSLRQIMDKLGIEKSSEYNRMGRNNNSFFNNPNNGTSVQSTYSNLLDDEYNE